MSDINLPQAAENIKTSTKDHQISSNSQEQHLNSPFRSSAPSSKISKSAPTIFDETLDPMFLHSPHNNLIKSSIVYVLKEESIVIN